MQVTGILKVLNDTHIVNDRFRKREFVLTDISNAEYPQHISMQLTQDRCNLLEGVKTGETITVHFNLRGREWTSPQGEIKYFNTIEAWKIDRNASPSETNAAPVMDMSNDMDKIDDTPF